MNIFKRKKYIRIQQKENGQSSVKPLVPDGSFVQCPACQKAIYHREIDMFKICPHCGSYFRLSAFERIHLISDHQSFQEFDSNMTAKNPLDFPGYEEKIEQQQRLTNIKESVICGKCRIKNEPSILCVMDSRFMMGSLGSVAGEKITRSFEYALAWKLPVIVVSASGGARMQEGIISLMQMAKISQAVAKHSASGLLFISVLTDPTYGGVSASVAMQADVIIAEPKASIGFAGLRVIEQITKESLPKDFQRAEFALEHGHIDFISERSQLRFKLSQLLKLHKRLST